MRRASRPATEPAMPPSVVAAGLRTIRSTVFVGWVRTLAAAGAAVAVGRLIDDVAAGRSTTSALGWLAGLLALRVVLAPLPPLLASLTATRVERDLQRRVVDAMVAIGPTDADRRTGALVAQATEGAGAVGDYAGRFVPQLVGGMTAPLLLAGVVATIDIPTALVLVILLPLIPGLLRGLEGRFASVTARYRETADTLAAQFLDGVQGLRTLRSLDRSETYGDAIAEEAERLRLDTMRLLRVNQLALLGVDSLFTIGTVVAAAGMAAWRLSNQAITVGDGVALVLLGVMLIEPLTQIGRFFYVGAIGRASAAQLGRLFAAAPPRVPPAAAAVASSPVSGDGGLPPRPTPPGTIVLHGVRFAYGDGPHVLRGITLSVAPGDKVALTGPSGAGKSTLVSLVAGLHRPTAGMIEVSGRVALVPQRPYLFTGTVGDNLRVARDDASDDRLWEVLDAAELGDLVRERGGLTTEVGERGLQLSGGEAQRLAVARALLLDAPIVVLDEPTSNVDLETEAKLNAAIARLTEGRTVLVIAHRRSTLSGCDRFLHMKAGVIAEAEFGPAADEDSSPDRAAPAGTPSDEAAPVRPPFEGRPPDKPAPDTPPSDGPAADGGPA